MTDKRPPKGAWKNEIPTCSKRGHHLFKVKGKQMVCTEPGCDYATDWVKKGPQPAKRDPVVRRARK